MDKYRGQFRAFCTLMLRISKDVWHQFIEHKCLQQASSLAFNTLLCLVPLSAVALFLLKTFGVVENEESPLIASLGNFLPRYGAEEIVLRLTEFTNRNLGRLSVGGFLFFLMVSTMLFMSVEQHFNDIWGARRRLPLLQAFQKYAVFYTLLSLGPLLIWLFFSTSNNWLFAHVFPWLLFYCIFLLMYIALPNTSVKWSAALIGTFIAGTLFQIARLPFGRYFELVWKNYNEIYGALALLVILAIWTYATWVIILLGAEVTNTVQHLGRNTHASATPSDEKVSYINVAGVLALFLVVAERFHRGKGACSAEDIVFQAGIPADVVDACFRRFKAAGLIYEVEGDTTGYLPAQVLSDITLDQVVDVVDGGISEHFTSVLPVTPEGTRILQELQRIQVECLKNVTVESLLS